MNLHANQNIIFELQKRVKNGRCEDFWRQYTDDILEYIQTEIDQNLSLNETQNLLHLMGKILRSYKHFKTIKLRGSLIERILNLVQDNQISLVPKRSFSVIITAVSEQHHGWRFFLDSINKLHVAGMTNDLFFIKCLSIVQGLFRTLENFDIGLAELLTQKFLVTHFENQTTIVRKQVVITLAELKLCMDERLLSQC